MRLHDLVSTFRAVARKNIIMVNPTDHHKVITSFFVMVIILLSLVTYSQSASSTIVTYGSKSTDTSMNYSPFRLPFSTGFASITTAGADTCQMPPTINATKGNLTDLTKPAAPTSIPMSTCTLNSTSGPATT